jgi:hypothetical protein
VVTPDPQVSVTQADPEVDVNVEARMVDPGSEEAVQAQNSGVTTRIEPEGAQDGQATTTADVSLDKGEPQVRLVEPNQEAQVAVNQGEPQVEYQSAEPDVQVSYAGEPRVRLRQVGEPNVTFNQAQPNEEGAQTAAASQAGNEQQQMQQDQQQASDRDAEQRRMLGMPAEGAATPTDIRQVSVQDLVGRNVVTSRNEDLGQISRVVSNAGQTYVVVEYGGFLGFGEEEVALPAQRVAMRDNDILLLGLTETDLDAMPDYDAGQDQTMASDAAIDMGVMSN